MNLLRETLNVLAQNGYGPSAVIWVGSPQMWTTWANFAAIADTEYDNGYGGPQVATDLMIVGIDWWLTRAEYDDAEEWEFHRMPERPSKQVAIHALTVGQANRALGTHMVGWEDLQTINGDGREEEEGENE